MGASHSLKATHVEFFSEEEEPEIDLGNITNSYSVPTTPNTRIHKDHPIENVIGDVKTFVQRKRMTKPTSKQGFLSDVYEQKIHDKTYCKALSHKAIGTKWIFRNKKDKRGVVIRNKARLVAQGLTQEEGIDYDEVFAPVAKIEAIRLFLAYASFIGFMVYQMDVKSAFLYGQIEEEVYVCQPPGFEDPNYPEKVYKVVKALYGLHQAPRAWYETFANYLLGNGFQRGKIDQTLFIKKQKGDILLVQIYVDDIIFGSTKKELCTEFEKLMKDKFQMSSMGELTFFLGLQVQQRKDGIFISHDKYVDEILRKFNYTNVKSASTPVDLEKLWSKMEMIPEMKKPTLGLWYSKDSSFVLVAYTDSDYAGATQDKKSTTRGCQFLRNKLISWQCKKQTVVATSTTEAEYVAVANTQHNVADLLTKGFDAGRFQYLVSSIGMFCDKHNMVAYLDKSDGSEGFHEIIDFLNRSHIKYALTKNPTIYVSFIKQFWRTATANTRTNGKVEIIATIDGHVKTITEASLRRHLKLEDNDGVPTLPNSEIFEQISLMGLENNLKQTKKTYSTALTKLILRVKKLEKQVKSSKAKRKAKITHWFQEDIDIQEDARVQQKQSHDTEVLLDEGEPTELIQDQGSSEKGQPEVTTAKTTLDTAEVLLSTDGVHLSTASTICSTARRIIYSRRSAEKRKDKGKAIMTEPEPVKKSKKQLEDAEIAQRLHEEINVVAQETSGQEKQTEEREPFIDWSDPSVIRYHALKLRPRSIAQARKNMCVYLKNQGSYKMKDFKGMSYDDIRQIFERVWDQIEIKQVEEEVQQEDVEAKQTVVKESSKVSRKRRKSLARKKETSKKQKLDEEETTNYEKEKEDLKMWLTVVPDEEEIMDPEVLHTSLMLWGDLKTMFEPDAEDEVWRNQQDWNLISWELYENCGVHTLLLDGTMISFHILKISESVFGRIISRRRLRRFISEETWDLRINHKFRGGLLEINLHRVNTART
ncbi:putative ribonuclease H-like domain-containing protein, partial [Tanacetum coccineum]